MPAKEFEHFFFAFCPAGGGRNRFFAVHYGSGDPWLCFFTRILQKKLTLCKEKGVTDSRLFRWCKLFSSSRREENPGLDRIEPTLIEQGGEKRFRVTFRPVLYASAAHYRLLRSDDVAHWQTLAEAQSGASNSLTLTDTAP